MNKNFNRKSIFMLLLLFATSSLKIDANETTNTVSVAEYQSVQANNLKVSGVVKDTKGEELIGVSIVVKGTNQGTITAVDGSFTIDVPKGATLEFTYIGYATKSIKVETERSLNIVLSEDTELLDEVVVTALGIKRSEKALSYNVQKVKDGLANFTCTNS